MPAHGALRAGTTWANPLRVYGQPERGDCSVDHVRIDIISKEFPPAIYGGEGVHVAELSRVLAPLVDLNVRCFGEPRDPDFHGATVKAYPVPADLKGANPALETLGTDLTMVDDIAGAELVHSHTWYANFAGHLAGLMHGIPHVVSAHSLEPLRPWKAEQLAGGYALSSFVEKTAYMGASAIIAVSDGMRRDILRSYPEVDPEKVHTVQQLQQIVRRTIGAWISRRLRRKPMIVPVVVENTSKAAKN